MDRSRISAPQIRDNILPSNCAADCNLVAEADHRIGNELAALSSYIRLKEREMAAAPDSPTREKDAQLTISAVHAQIRSLSRLHRILTSRGGHLAVDLHTMLEEVCAPFDGDVYRPVVLARDLSRAGAAHPDQVSPICQIVAEAITNAFKYAYPPGQAGEVTVRAHRGKTGELVIEVADHGVGLAQEPKRNTAGFGLGLMGKLAKALGARMEFEDRLPGVCVRLSILQRSTPS